MQSYLKPNNILTLEEQRNIFSYRVRANNLNYNMPSNKVTQLCLCGEELNNSNLYTCDKLNENSKSNNQSYSDIFNGTIHAQKRIVNILMKNLMKIERISTPGTSD